MEHRSTITGPITVRSNFGKAIFERTSDTEAEFALSYETPALEFGDNFTGEDLAWACWREIAHMRRAITDLGVALASRLSTKGRRPTIMRHWEGDEHRRWHRTDDGLHVAASAWTTRESLEGVDGVSDRMLVLGLISLVIKHRQGSIRNSYAQILREAKTPLREIHSDSPL